MSEKNNNDFENENKKLSANEIFSKYGGAIIGGVVAILICFTHLYKLILSIVVIVAGVVAGNYIQKNKDSVKQKLKELIDKF